MTNEEALQFLSANQPLPPDGELGDKIKVFDEVRKHFKINYDERSIAPITNAFGDGDGFGVYQMVEDTLQEYPVPLVVQAVKKALSSIHHGVRYWNAQMAAVFPSEELVQPLMPLLNEDFDMRHAVILALSQIGSSTAQAVMREHLSREADDELREVITDALDAD